MLPVDKLKELLDSIQKETMEPKKGSKEAVKGKYSLYQTGLFGKIIIIMWSINCLLLLATCVYDLN